MKRITSTVLIAVQTLIFAQFSGNINYKEVVEIPSKELQIPNPSTNQILVTAKGMANVKADHYIAIFTITQVGMNEQETNQIIDMRIRESLNEIKKLPSVETFTDMVSFVPMYEFIAEKKIFSRRTYNEIPKGFEMKKNLHIAFSNPEQLSEFIKILSKNEIYDLVRVDYYSTKLDEIKKELSNKVKNVLTEKVKSYETLTESTFKSDDKSLSEGMTIKYPTEMYGSYEASNSTSLTNVRTTNLNLSDKNISRFYQPVFDKEYDYVMNPIVLEPVIQVLYEIKMLINKKPEKEKKEFLLLTPNGELKSISVGVGN